MKSRRKLNLTNPHNYKRQSNLIKMMNNISENYCSDFGICWWLHEAKNALTLNFGWEEKAASKFVSRYYPTKSYYTACS